MNGPNGGLLFNGPTGAWAKSRENWQKRTLIDDDGDGYTAKLTATAQKIVVEGLAAYDSVEVEYGVLLNASSLPIYLYVRQNDAASDANLAHQTDGGLAFAGTWSRGTAARVIASGDGARAQFCGRFCFKLADDGTSRIALASGVVLRSDNVVERIEDSGIAYFAAGTISSLAVFTDTANGMNIGSWFKFYGVTND